MLCTLPVPGAIRVVLSVVVLEVLVVLVVLVHEVVLGTSSHLLVLGHLVVTPVLCHLSGPAFCQIMTCPLAEGAEFIFVVRRELRSPPFPACHHGMAIVSAVTTVSRVLSLYAGL